MNLIQSIQIYLSWKQIAYNKVLLSKNFYFAKNLPQSAALCISELLDIYLKTGGEYADLELQRLSELLNILDEKVVEVSNIICGSVISS